MSRNDSSAALSSRPEAALFWAIALISAAVLGYEVALTRVFAVLLRYQFAFLVVSLALCGLGLGGLVANRFRRLSLESVAVVWGLSAAAALLLILRGVFAYVPQHYWIAALIVLIPFGAAGTFLSLVFSRYSAWGGRLYAFDLAGAALAAGGSVALMQWLGAVQACLVFAALGALAGALVTQKKGFPLVMGGLLLALVPYNARLGLWSVQPIPPNADKDGNTLADRGVTQPFFTELGDPKAGSKIVDTRWNAFARTDVVLDPTNVGSYLLYTNGNVPTNMMRWDGKIYSIPTIVNQFALPDWVYSNANLKNQRVMSIGPGGGLDALLALRYGANRFDGAEINPSIVGLMNEPKYRDWNGGIYQRPEVHVQVAEGRAFVREARAQGVQYKLIYSALTKTATAGQGAALLESFIYTSDAFNDYLSVLKDDGQLAIVGDAPPLLARLFATAVAHFKAQGQTEAQAGRHIAAIYYESPGPYQWALVVQKQPFTAAQTALMNSSARQKKMFPLWIPDQASSDELFPFGSLGGGSLSLDAFIQSGLNLPGSPLPLDLAPDPDDRPFVLDLALSPYSIFQSSKSLTILLGLSLLGTVAFAAVLLLARPAQATGEVTPVHPLFSLIYFLALGIGFMLVEIPLISKLVLPLGYPTLALTVILFSILLGGGGGALFSQRFEGEKLRIHALSCALGIVIYTALLSVLAGAVGAALLPLPLVLRIIVVTVLLLPLGFLLGTPFPSGMRLFVREAESSSVVPLIWALNGTASVVGSILAAVAAKALGYGSVLLVGALFYAVATVILARTRTEI